MRRALAATVPFAAFACSSSSGPPPDGTAAAVTMVETPKPPAQPAATAAVTASSEGPKGPCGAFRCRTFDAPRAAFDAALAGKPLIVGVGEAHAQKGAGSVPTIAKRFTADFLPGLQGRASDLLVELMMPPTGCKKATEEVRSAHAPVTEKQSEANQNDYVAMGDAARKLGVVPDLLRPSCDDLASVADAGADAVPRTLETIARLSIAQTKALLARKDRAADAMIVLYGGALHNDSEPPPERAAWSYGAEMSKLASGRYVEIDVFAADLIRDEETWRRLPWFAHYDKGKLGDKTTLYELRAGSFVIVLPAAR